MQRFLTLILFCSTLPMAAQTPLPPLHDGIVIDQKAEFRQDAPLRIAGRVKLKDLTLDLLGPVTFASGADFELEGVTLKVSDPRGTANGTSGLFCDGPAKVTIRRSSMRPEGSAHPIWRLKGDLTVNDFQTENSEFHLDHVQGHLENFTIFELEISKASHISGKNLHLVFLSTHTGASEKLDFSDIPVDHSFSQKLQMGSEATADLTDTSIQMFLLYVHGSSQANLSRIGRAQLAIAPSCRGNLRLPHGMVGAAGKPLVVPEPGASDCPFRFTLQEVNADTWDVYAGKDADLTFSDSVIDELTGDGQARLTVKNSEVYADWLSLGGNASLQVENSTVGAQRLVASRPDLATSQVRLNGHSQATFEKAVFDCGVLAGGNSTLTIRDSAKPPAYLWRAGHASVTTKPELSVEDLGEEKH